MNTSYLNAVMSCPVSPFINQHLRTNYCNFFANTSYGYKHL